MKVRVFEEFESLDLQNSINNWIFENGLQESDIIDIKYVMEYDSIVENMTYSALIFFNP